MDYICGLDVKLRKQYLYIQKRKGVGTPCTRVGTKIFIFAKISCTFSHKLHAEIYENIKTFRETLSKIFVLAFFI